MEKRLSTRVQGTLTALSLFLLFLGVPAEALASTPVGDVSLLPSNDSAVKKVPASLGAVEATVKLAQAASDGETVAVPLLPAMTALCLPQVCPRSPPQHS